MTSTSRRVDDRIDLLLQASALCRSLATVLRTLGPKDACDVLYEDTRGDQASVDQQHRQRRIRSLEGELQQEFQCVLQARNQVLAPIYRVTNDILRLLFLADHDEDTVNTDAHIDSITRLSMHAYTVSSVCHRWRTVALQTAPLWSYLIIKAPKCLQLDDERTHPWHDRTSALVMTKSQRLCLSRSNKAPLTVYIIIQNEEHLSGAADVFESVAGRVRDLTVLGRGCDPRTGVQFLRCWIFQAQDSLLRLRLSGLPALDSSESDGELTGLFVTAGLQLREMHLEDVLYPKPSTFAVGASCRVLNIHIRRPVESNFSFDSGRLLLNTCPRLEDFTLLVDVHLSECESLLVPLHSDRISMYKLTSLTVYLACDISFPFDIICAPNLQRLKFSLNNSLTTSYAGAGAVMGPAILRMLDASDCQLKEFCSARLLSKFVCPILLKVARSIHNLECHLLPGPNRSLTLQYQDIISPLRDVHPDNGFPLLKMMDFGCRASTVVLTMILDVLEFRRDHGESACRLQLKGWESNYGDHSDEPEIPDSSESAYALEEKVASLLEYFSVGNWVFNKEKRMWEGKAPPFSTPWTDAW